MKNGKPVIAWCGMGRAGKDTAAEYARDKFGLVYAGGSSWVGRVYMAKRLSEDEGRLVTPDEAYANRHKDRDKWYRYLNEYRHGDPTRLLRECLIYSDMICGPRDGFEMVTACKEGLIDLAVWVENPRAPVDKTVTFTVDDCDVVVHNNGTHELFYRRLDRLIASLGFKKLE